MADRYTEGLLEHADVVASTTAPNGEIRVNVGDARLGTGIDSNVPFWGIDGFLSRPADPTSAGAAQYVFFRNGNQRYGFGSRDRRFLSVAGTLDAGDRVIYSPGGLRLFLDDSDTAVLVTGASTSTQNVSLYPPLQSYLQEILDTLQLLIAGDPTAIPPVPGLGTLLVAVPGGSPLGTALVTQLATLVAASADALNDATASSATLRASTT